MRLEIQTPSWPLEHPFRITGYTFTETKAIWVRLAEGEHAGVGEAVGSYYLDETVASMTAEVESIRAELESGITTNELQKLLPPGGARNAVDCALWDLSAKKSGKSIFELLQIDPKPVQTVATIGIGSDEFMRQRALDFSDYQYLKIKLDAERPIERVRTVREVRPDATLVIDANQAWDRRILEEVTPQLHDLGVAMIEQPVARGKDAQLAGFKSPIPLGADESCLSLAEYEQVAEYYEVINIKLDKCGGLTEAMQIVQRAQADGKKLMVGNMTGSSLSMAPAFLVAQFCDFVDIDGPLLLKEDIANGLKYSAGGWVAPPTGNLWG